MSKYHFTKSYKVLQNQLIALSEECEKLFASDHIETFEQWGNVNLSWKENVRLWIQNSINPSPKYLVEEFNKVISRSTNSLLFKNDLSEVKAEDIRGNREALKALKGYLLILEKIRHIQQEEISGVQEKLDYIMLMLHYVFGDHFYSVKVIMELGDVPYREGEPEELAELLIKKEYVQLKEVYSIERLIIRLTVKGAAYVERKQKSKSKQKKQTDTEEMNQKLDLVLEKLQTLGYGQEIIYEELEELRNLYGTLNKKNWGQLLKGKLVDLALGKVINDKTASYIFETLTEGAFKLIS